ncbi:cell envelope integrity protein TolA [Sporosarcina sp. ACRSL]|uniref:cell envelope integrity protein TolA n=1 Tax=Sporosarcina sp. ACRSL TaxID=2918215 RepID=UPI001EF669BF|nr:cell envelope integrity protein TolA [Sporosarcina sp. ACRSL]MCG7345367.1 cell envelope integrity protein TolA [Sporosarcina sp. ACRSL]
MSEVKTKKPFYKRAWFIAVMAFLVIGFLATVFESDEAKEERLAENAAKAEAVEREKADREAKKQAKADARAEEQALIDDTINRFNEAKLVLIEDSGGVITDATIEYNINHYRVDVYVDEATWAASTESEKQSFVTTIGIAMQKSLPDTTLVDFRSAQNDDVVASGKLLGGYKIKR